MRRVFTGMEMVCFKPNPFCRITYVTQPTFNIYLFIKHVIYWLLCLVFRFIKAAKNFVNTVTEKSHIKLLKFGTSNFHRKINTLMQSIKFNWRMSGNWQMKEVSLVFHTRLLISPMKEVSIPKLKQEISIIIFISI